MHPRHRIDPDSWSIVMDFLCPEIRTVIEWKRWVHDQLKEIAYANYDERNKQFYFSFTTEVKAKLRPQLCKAYAKQDQIWILNQRSELSRLKLSQEFERVPRCLRIVVSNMDSIMRFYNAREWDRQPLTLVWNHKTIQLVVARLTRDGPVSRLTNDGLVLRDYWG